MLCSETTAREACTRPLGPLMCAPAMRVKPAPLMLCAGTTGHVYPPPMPVHLHLCPVVRTTVPVLQHLRVAPVADQLLGDHVSLYLRLHMQGISLRVLWKFWWKTLSKSLGCKTEMPWQIY
ncbi:hypothetical protein V6N13_103452 [Hibiscus sabdariffa]